MPQYQTKPDAKWLTSETHARKRQWQIRNAEKRAAHKAVEYALMRGDLIRQPCERCASETNVQAHHDDYSRPLDVMWLCQPCHIQRHRELRAMREAA